MSRLLKTLNIRRCLVALLIPSVMMGILYVMDICSFSTGAEVKLLKYASIAESAFLGSENVLPEDVLLVNVSYDKVLVPVYDEFGFLKGETDITDREKLYRLLKIAERCGNYKYILLDVFFEKGLASDSDSLLFTQVSSMPRIAVPKHSNGELADSILLSKAFYAEYRTDIENSGFIKFPLCVRKEPSMPSAMYEECSGHKLQFRSLYAKDEGRLMQMSLLPTLDLSGIAAYGPDGRKNILNLSSDLLVAEESGLLEKMLENKYIVIGSFNDADIHDTFRGDLPGCLLNLNVFFSLMDGRHILHFSHIAFLWLVFSLMGLDCISGTNLFKTKNRLLTVFLSWINFSIISAIVCLIYYYCFHKAFDIFVAATLFELLKRIIVRFRANEV